MSDIEKRLQAIEDRQAIMQLSIDYARGLDRLDVELVKSVYHEDSTDDRGFFKGTGHELAVWAIESLSAHHFNHHMMGQMDIAIDGDVAFGEIYFQALHRWVEDDKEIDFMMIARYADRYEKRDGVWKIAHRSELSDACWQQPATDSFFTTYPNTLRGARGAADLTSQRERLRTA